jgi:hypothetical protein
MFPRAIQRLRTIRRGNNMEFMLPKHICQQR